MKSYTEQKKELFLFGFFAATLPFQRHTGLSSPNLSQHIGRKQSGDHSRHSQGMESGFRDNICSRGQIKSDNFPGVKEKEQKSKLNTPLEDTEEQCALRAGERNENNKCFKSEGSLDLIDLKH